MGGENLRWFNSQSNGIMISLYLTGRTKQDSRRGAPRSRGASYGRGRGIDCWILASNLLNKAPASSKTL